MALVLQQLEHALVLAPENEGLYAPLADALVEQGDTHGELIHQSLRADSDWTLVEAQRDTLRVRAGTPDNAELRWERGFVSELRCGLADSAAFLEGRLFLLLRSLTVAVGPEPTADVAAMVPRRATLKRLRFDAQPTSELGDMSALWAQLPGLISLTVINGRCVLGALPSEQLMSLCLVNTTHERSLEALLSSTAWPSLRTLRVTASKGGLEFLSAERMPALRELTLETTWAEPCLRAAISSRMLPRLEAFKCDGVLDDAGLERLLRVMPTLGAVKRIQLVHRPDDDSTLDAGLLKKLRGFPQVNIVIGRLR